MAKARRAGDGEHARATVPDRFERGGCRLAAEMAEDEAVGADARDGADDRLAAGGSSSVIAAAWGWTIGASSLVWTTTTRSPSLAAVSSADASVVAPTPGGAATTMFRRAAMHCERKVHIPRETVPERTRSSLEASARRRLRTTSM